MKVKSLSRPCATLRPAPASPGPLEREVGVGVEKSESEVAQSCPTLSDPMDCSLPGSSVHGIFQARRVLEWGAIAFSDHMILEPTATLPIAYGIWSTRNTGPGLCRPLPCHLPFLCYDLCDPPLFSQNALCLSLAILHLFACP